MVMNKQEILDEDAFLDTTLGLSDDELTRRFKEAVKLEKKRCKIMGLPIAEYDGRKKKAYLLYPDGHREYYD